MAALPVAPARRHAEIRAFLLVGGVTFLVDASLLQGSWMLGVPLPVATTIGYVLGLVVHFTLNRALTFRARGGAVRAQLGPYLLNVAISYALTQAIVNGGHALWPIAPAVWKGVAVGVTMTCTDLMLKHVVFRQR